MSKEYKDWRADRIKEEKQILRKYPFLRTRTIDGEVDTETEFPMICLEIPNGWYRLFYQMCDDIRPILKQEGLMDRFYFIQVKEKYDELICYTNGIEPLSVQIILQKYKYLSKFICVHCGKPAEFITLGYLASLCKNCLNKRMTADNYTDIQFIDTHEVIGFDTGTKKQYTNTISVKEEWERYLDNYGKTT